MAYEAFARRLTVLLTSGLRQVCHVTVRDITQQSYDEYISSLEAQTLMVPITVSPLPGTGALEFTLPIALAAIDHMLGGPGGTQPVRSLTDIETTLIHRLIDQILDVLRFAFEPIVAVQPVAGAIEYNPQFLQAASGADAVVVGEFDLTIGRESCRLTLSLPLAPLLPRLITQRPREQMPADVARLAGRRMRENVGDMPVEIRVRFRPVGLAPTRILSLAVGDVIVLDHRVGMPMTVETDGVAITRAIAGKSGSRLAALVVDSPAVT
jgi:flagellar motor switch protein FliM